MAVVVVCSKNFAFGPTGKLLTIVRPLVDQGHEVIFLGSGAAYQLASKERFHQILDVDPKDPYFEYFTHMLVRRADLVVSDQERRIIELAQRFGIKNIYIDSMFWYRETVTDEVLNTDVYLIQKSFDHGKNFRKYAGELKNARVVEPIIDLSELKSKHLMHRKKQVLVALGGLGGGELFSVGTDSHYPHVVLELLAREGNFDGFDTVLVTGNVATLGDLAPRLRCLNPKFRLELLAHRDFLKAIAESAVIMLAPGLETTLEAFAYAVPAIFLPPSNDTQYLHLDFLRRKRAATMSVHFPDYYSRLAYRGDIKKFFGRYLTQLQTFEHDRPTQQDMIARINAWLHDTNSQQQQVRRQEVLMDDLGRHGLEESLHLIVSNIPQAEESYDPHLITHERSTALTYVAAEDRDGTKVTLCSPLLHQEVGPVRGQTVLDYGCGEGWLSREFEQRGAKRVVGVDTSPEMIDMARYRTHAKRVSFLHTPTTTLAGLENDSVDKVVACFTFVHAPSERSLTRSFEEIYRVLKPGGQLVYLITHPAFLDKPFHNTERIFSYGPFSYMTRGLKYDVHYKSHLGHEMLFQSYHYPLESYLDAATQSGFLPHHAHEIVPTVSFLKHYGFSMDLLTYPQYFLSSIVKPSVAHSIAAAAARRYGNGPD
jgi:SAM-dependent methyltransferase